MHASRPLFALLLLSAFVAPASAAGRWAVRAGGGEAISETHGSALEAALVVEAKPDLWLGLETGLCKMDLKATGPGSHVFGTQTNSLPGTAASLTDGITRDRVFFVGPQVRWGSSMYLVASYGMADVRTSGAAGTDYLQGGSVGVGVGGMSHFEPSAELRLRWVSDAFPGHDPGVTGSAITFTVGMHVRQ